MNYLSLFNVFIYRVSVCIIIFFFFSRSDILHLCVTGGNLDHADSQILRENGGRELIISYLNTSGKVCEGTGLHEIRSLVALHLNKEWHENVIKL